LDASFWVEENESALGKLASWSTRSDHPSFHSPRIHRQGIA